jgi:hypothetical protein
MSTTEAEKLLAEGDKLKLKDGTFIPLRYGYRELFELEREFGNVQVVFDALQSGLSGNMLGTFLPALAIGAHMEFDELVDKLDSQDLPQHISAFGRSLQQAFPQTAQEMATPESETTGTEALTGKAPTISQPAATDEVMTPIGA